MSGTDYKSTLRLPKTDFPMKANLPKREPETLKRWDEIDLYARLIESRRNAKLWVLHDGPPYANGRVHLGTALNKILKDFVVRSRSMMGYRTPFVPGWDCHGMPIEHRVTLELGERARTIPKLELRRLCREYAEKWIDLQRIDFRRLGALGNWQHPYLTMSPEYEAAEVAVLRKMVEGGYVYRGLRPVHWCMVCRTALSEAEVDYSEHRSPSIYVAFRVNDRLKDAAALASDGAAGAELAVARRAGKLFAVIWTTTPWTLPANLGISANETFEYVAIKSGGAYYIVAARLADEVAKACGLAADRQIALSRDALKALDGADIFRHPFADRDVKLMFGEHVSADTGTGLVHTAPGHGYEDYVAGQRYGIEPFTPVDDDGVFTKDAGAYAGRNVFEANDAIVETLRGSGALLAAQTIAHQYPHCWRCHNPLIFRATEQWFVRIDHNGLRATVLAGIDQAKWVPSWSRDRIRNMTETRPDWCISRQRAWGLPIPAIKCVKCGRVTLDVGVLKAAEIIFGREGSDAWYTRPVADFIAPDLRCADCGGAEYARTEDVLDVWFDAGCSQSAVLAQRAELTWPADAYLEAVEQARGWFSSSLTCAAVERGRAPFREVINSGLVLDELGRKLSKSLGNSEDIADLTGRTGADVIRLLFASVDYSADAHVGEALFAAVGESYRKLRNTARFMLGNLADFDPARDSIAIGKMAEFDRFILARAERFKAAARRAYDEYDFRAVYQAAVNFAVGDLSSLYIDVARDRLYCAAPASIERRSAQTALHLVLDTFVKILAPLIPFTADEIHAHLPGRSTESVHLLEFAPPQPSWAGAELEARWESLLGMRGEALKLLETMRQAEVIGAPLEAALQMHWDGTPASAPSPGASSPLRASDPELLKELFIVSKVDLLEGSQAAWYRDQSGGREDFNLDGSFVRNKPPLLLVGRRAPGLKCARCWTYFDDGGDPELCPRCRTVLRANR